MQPQRHRDTEEAQRNAPVPSSGPWPSGSRRGPLARCLRASPRLRAYAVAWLCVLSPTALEAQYLRSTPLALAGGRVVIGGDVQASVAPPDNESWFNYTDYEHDALRMLRW